MKGKETQLAGTSGSTYCSTDRYGRMVGLQTLQVALKSDLDPRVLQYRSRTNTFFV